jgi:hypothetical protein
MLDVTAYWALAATSVHDFAAPVEIDVDNTVGNVVPATLDGGSWRALAPVAGQSLPAGQADGFYRDGSDVVVLTRHLSFFTLLEDVQAPTVPSGFKGAVKRGKITLSWKAATDAGGIAAYRVYANGGLVRTIGAGARSAAMGEFTISDRRSFQVAAEDVAGNLGAKSFKLKVVPRVARLPLAAAKTALVRRGFEVGKVAHRRSSSVPAGKVVRGSASGLRRAGSKIGLTVSTGSRASSGTDALATPPPPASAAGFPPPPPSAGPAPSDPVPASPVPPASAPAPEEQSTHAGAQPQIRPEPLAEHASAGARKPLGYVLLALAFGAAALASLRRLRGLRPAQAVPSGFEPLLLWDARLLRLATGTARRLAGRA